VKEELIDINIPAGVGSGMKLTMQGYGNSVLNGISGDLHINRRD
jgi:molecular chaperone DnaJ